MERMHGETSHESLRRLERAATEIHVGHGSWSVVWIKKEHWVAFFHTRSADCHRITLVWGSHFADIFVELGSNVIATSGICWEATTTLIQELSQRFQRITNHKKQIVIIVIN